MTMQSTVRRLIFAWCLISASALAQESQANLQSVAKAREAPSSIAVARDEAQFDEMVLRAPWPVVVVFRVDWCGFCKRFEKVSKEALAQSGGRFSIVHVDPEKSPQLAKRWMRKNGYPEIQMFHHGARVKAPVAGAMDAQQFQTYLGDMGAPSGAKKPQAKQPKAAVQGAGREIQICDLDDFERRVVGSKLPVVVIFKNDDSISSNRMLARARAALSRPGRPYILAVVDADDAHEEYAQYSNYPELQAWRAGERWDMEEGYPAGEIDKATYANYVATITQELPPCAPAKR